MHRGSPHERWQFIKGPKSQIQSYIPFSGGYVGVGPDMTLIQRSSEVPGGGTALPPKFTYRCQLNTEVER
jgi:hypothetical protein